MMITKPIDKDENGHALYVTAIFTDGRIGECYFISVNDDGTDDLDAYSLKIDDIRNSNDALAKIKEENGWIG